MVLILLVSRVGIYVWTNLLSYNGLLNVKYV